MDKKIKVTVKTASGTDFEIELNFWKGKRVYNNFDLNYYDIQAQRYPKNGNTIIHRQLTEIIEKELKNTTTALEAKNDSQSYTT